jgi:hypothetical protein
MHWVGYDQVHKPGSQTQDINVNPLSEKEELPPVALRFLSMTDEEDSERFNMFLRTREKNVGRFLQQKGCHTWWGPSLGVRYFTLLKK